VTNSIRLIAGLLVLAASGAVHAQYKQPPEPLLSTMRVPVPAVPRLDPTGTRLLLVQQSQYPSIERVAEPYLKLAGVRIEPKAHTRHDMSSGYGIRACLQGFTLVDVASRAQTPVELPKDACPDLPLWSADGSKFAFSNTTADTVELWIGDAASGKTRRIDGVALNTILDDEFQWLGGKDELLVKRVPSNLGPAPQKSQVPTGPEITDATDGKGGESSTYEARDTLKSPEDEALFDYYATSQLAVVEVASGKLRDIGKAAVYSKLSVAPDGRHVLAYALKRPYSYVTTWERFAHDVIVMNVDRPDHRHVIASNPVADRVPVRGVPTGPRDFHWRANRPATLIYAEALDGGDWRNDVPYRERVLSLEEPFKKPVEIARMAQHFAGLFWFAEGSRAILAEYDMNRRWYTLALMDVDKPKQAQRVLWSHSMDERYANPGNPVFTSLPNGHSVLREDQGALFLSGLGASPQGDRPFLDRYELASGKTQRLFRSETTAFERFIGFVGKQGQFLTWRESQIEPPNAWLRTLGEPLADAPEGEAVFASSPAKVTDFPDPAPLVRQIQKKLVTYKRADGVDLSFTLYLPPDYQEGDKLPAILYAYPQDFADPSQAGQVRGSEHTFTRLSDYRLLLLAGYALIDSTAFPIVGDPKNAYDTYLEQLVADAQAAIDKAVEFGIDRDRIGVLGHSHGALMVANLLAHTDLFRAGVARSGGYNKTLTPFGFQNERRSFWEAPKVYDQVSSFFHADKIDEPILIVHGSDDANPGTEPTQSPRLFQAVRGLGGTARLVMLPFEPHWYTARESNEHLVAETLEWFDRYVKNAAPREAKK